MLSFVLFPRYVSQGSFQVPLVKGEPPLDVLEAMQFTDCITMIEEEMAKGRSSRFKYDAGQSP